MRGPQTAAAACALALGALLTWRVSDDSAALFFYALPALVAALLLTWEEAVFTAVGGFLLFLGLLTVERGAALSPTVLALAAVCALALLLALRRRPAPGVQHRLPQFTPAAGMLGRVAADLAASLDLHHLLGSMAQQLTVAVGVSRCAILLVEDDRLRLAASTGAALVAPFGDAQGRVNARLRGLREPLVVTPDTEGVDRAEFEELGAHRVLVLPFVAQGELLGVAVLDEPGQAAEFGKERIGVGQAVAGFAALMINNAGLYERQSQLAAQLAERSSTMEGLLRLGYELRATLDLDQVLRRVAETVLGSLGYREVSLFLFDQANETYQARVSLGGPEELDGYYLANPIPRRVFEQAMRPEFRMGNSYFRQRRRAAASEEERRLLPFTDLGARDDDEWQTGDTLLVPLLSRDGRTLGALDVYDPLDRRLPTMESIRGVEIFGNQAAVAIENAQQYAALEVQELRLERQLQSQQDLMRVSESIVATLDEEVVFESIADKLRLLVEYDTLAISKVDWEARRIVTVFARDEYAQQLIDNPIGVEQGLWGWAVTHDEALLCNAAHADPRSTPVPGTPIEPQASIVLPLHVMNKVIAVLNLDRLGGKTYSEEEFELVKPFANLAAIAIENASLYEKSQLRAVTDPLTGLYNHGHFQETLEHEVRRCERYGAGFSLLMMDLDHFKRVNDHFGHPRGDHVLGQVAQILADTTREADYAARYGGEEFAILLPETTPDDARLLAERIRTQVRDIVVAADDEFHVSASIGVADFPVCGLDAKTILGAADTALLWAKRRGRNCVLYYRDARAMMAASPTDDAGERSWRNGLEVLAAAVDAKASFRERHGEAVTEMVGELAETAGLPAGDREIYQVAARLHDVGKVGISAEILEKGDRLTDDDRRELQRHVELGVDIFTNAEAPREFIEIVRHHHERWDGQGYPDGLRGEEIPMGARLIAICDSFQAMLSDRPYRAALTLDEARAEIRRGAGEQFDPGLARLFLDRCRTSGATVVPPPAIREAAPGALDAGAAPADEKCDETPAAGETPAADEAPAGATPADRSGVDDSRT
jgi:diguanylate cyclase (GGDEF)-like protein/putative nucleotidyltransferase with HDIG domain